MRDEDKTSRCHATSLLDVTENTYTPQGVCVVWANTLSVGTVNGDSFDLIFLVQVPLSPPHVPSLGDKSETGWRTSLSLYGWLAG